MLVAVLGLCLCLYALIGGLVALDYERVKLELYDCRRSPVEWFLIVLALL